MDWTEKLLMPRLFEGKYSQDNQDGIIQYIFKNIETTNKFCIEFGFDTTRNPTECVWHSSEGKQNFSYNDSKGLWHCFNCKESGDVITLYMKWYKCEFKNAKKELTEKIGIKIKKQPLTIGTLKLDNYQDNAEKFHDKQPYFYDKNDIFWIWNKEEYKWDMTDETDIMNKIEQELGFAGQTINSRVKNSYLESFKRVGRLRIPQEAPKTWVQFKNQIFDITTMEIFQATPQHFICNPIPWIIGEESKTPTIDKLFKEWVGLEYMDTLYEILAYCCYTDYPIHLIFCLTGTGRNGKTSFQKLLTKFIGLENICSTELDFILKSRFESAKLYKKLVCALGETNFGILQQTSLLKRLCGQDIVGFEFKNKKLFDGYNYAKIIINSNSLPTSEDTSDGFYRRWLIIDFLNEFDEGKDIINIIPEQEYNNLAKKITEKLPILLECGVFNKQGSIDERKNKYILTSNPLDLFIATFCEKEDVNAYVRYSELYTNYIKFLNKIKKRQVGHKEFNTALTNAGYEKIRTSRDVNGNFESGWFISGLKFNGRWDNFMHDMHDMFNISTSSRGVYSSKENEHNVHNEHNSPVEMKVG